MTVAGEATAVSGVDLDAAEREFNDVFRTLLPKITTFLHYRLEIHQRPLAEDLASEAFTALWTSYYARGQHPENPRPLLYTIARRMIGKHFADQHKRDVVLDLGDPANTPIIATGSTYGAGMPEVAGLVTELEVAMEQMALASENWRTSHKNVHSLRRRLEDDYVVSDNKATNRKQFEAATAEQVDFLRTFRNACERVGNLRGRIEVVAGPAWKSPTGLPSPVLRGKGQDGDDYRTNPTVKQCPHGHVLDADTVAFRGNGDRECRRCSRAMARRHADPDSTKRGVPEATIKELREALADPGNADLSIAKICKGFDLSPGVAHARIPDLQQLRDTAAAEGSTLRKKLNQARALLTDPACDLSPNKIAEMHGMRADTLRSNLPAEFDAYRQRLQDRRDSQFRVAAALLRDPQCALSLQGIAEASGTTRNAITRNLADDVAAYRARRSEMAASR